MVENLEELKKICHNQARFTERPWWYRLYRAISIRATRLILRTGIKVNPTLVTILAIITGVGGALLLLSGSLKIQLLGFGLLFLSYLFDCIDGELARYYRQFSPAGVYLDELGHALIDPLLFAALTLSILAEQLNLMIVIFGFITVFSVRLVKVNSQLSAVIFAKEVKAKNQEMFNQEPILNTGTNHKEEEPEEGKRDKLFLTKLTNFTNTLKHYVPLVFIFLLVFLLDHFLPPIKYKLILLIFYSIFLPLVIIMQTVLNLRNMNREISTLLRQTKEIVSNFLSQKEESKDKTVKEKKGRGKITIAKLNLEEKALKKQKEKDKPEEEPEKSNEEIGQEEIKLEDLGTVENIFVDENFNQKLHK